jgi:putative transposase
MAGKNISLLVHFTWSTAKREPWIDAAWHEPLFAQIGGIMRNKKAKLFSAGGMPDHIHLSASLPSTLSLAELVNAVKSNSSRWVHQTYSQAREFASQEGYGAFSVSKSEENKVIQYIRNQQRHHQKRTFKEEFLLFLERHRIEYDKKYLWD